MKLWALNVCVACILAGALDLFLPRQGSFKSIKTVLALYILVSVVTPAAGADWTGLASLSYETSVQPAAGEEVFAAPDEDLEKKE